MSRFAMARAYEGIRPLNTDNLLIAVKTTLNNEGDLYVDGTIVMSVLGFEIEKNISNLAEYGIAHYIAGDCHRFKWADESKNIRKYYAYFFEHSFWKPNCMDVQIHDYRTKAEEREFNSLDEIFAVIRADYLPRIPEENISIVEWDDEGCRSHKLPPEQQSA